jgi:hypothetical protein
MATLAALATSAGADSDNSDTEASATSRLLQISSLERVQVPREAWCKPGFADITNGKAFFWKCGIGCEGSYGGWTDGCCSCACVPHGTAAPVCAHPMVASEPSPSPTMAPPSNNVAGTSTQPVSQASAYTYAPTIHVRNELHSQSFLPKSTAATSAAGRAPAEGSTEEAPRVPTGLIAVIASIAFCVVCIFFCLLFLFQGCQGTKKISRVQPWSEPVVNLPNLEHAAWTSQNAYPQPVATHKIDTKGDANSECETASTCYATPRSVVTAAPSDASSWRSPRTCPQRLSVQSNERFGAMHSAIEKQLAESSRYGSLLAPDGTMPPGGVRSHSASPRPSHTSMGDSQLQEHRRARSSSPRPSLRSTADANQQIEHRGRPSSRSASPRPLNA